MKRKQDKSGGAGDRNDTPVGPRDTSDTGRVLLVDDSRMVRAVVRSFLEPRGYVVDEAGDGESALSKLDEAAFDVVVSDLTMPGMDGLALLQEIRDRGLGTEVILLTSHDADMGAAVRALRLGAHDYLTKPPSGPEPVLLAVGRALEKKRLLDANKRLLAELEALSRTDALTGVGNRRAFDEALLREVPRAQRYRVPLSLVMVDLDHFKKVNDEYGHSGGDEVLRHFGRLVKAVIRESDSAFRYGGEEFALLLPHTDAESACVGARRLVERLAATPVGMGKDRVLRVTCSAGVAGLDAGADEMVARADAALYAAKRGGRNQVQRAGGPDEPPAKRKAPRG
jgi:two-component system cell cycle response regulator